MENDNVNGIGFKYHALDDRLVELEKRIKVEIRRYSLNLPVRVDVERYSDRYSASLLTEELLLKRLNVELMSPEIISEFGYRKEKKVEDIREEGESNEEEEEEDEETESSDEVDNDYVMSFYDEDDDAVTEKEEEGCIF